MNQLHSFLQKIFIFSFSLLISFSLTTYSDVLANEVEVVTITGKVIDALTEEPLPGANVRIKDTIIGDATDINGDFTIRGVQEGETILVVSYLGFVTQEVIFNSDSDEPLVIRLEQEVIAGEEVVVSVQAQGQREAINQQIASNTAKNVVSSTKIQELPEANAAEAVGRLPGITLQREGGEGTKVIVRGLSPEYSKITLEGVSLSSTDDGNRSTDLSMISSYMLAGIEVSKAATADQEGDQIGGNVNFRIKEAGEEPTLNFVAQGGYADIKNTYNDYKFVVNGSRRFFDNKFGVFANIDLDRVNRSSNSVRTSYGLAEDVVFANGDTSDVAVINGQTLEDINRVKTRTGATLVLDYDLPNTRFQYFGMFNNVETATTSLQESLALPGRDHFYNVYDQTEDLGQITHSLTIEQELGGLKLTASGSFNSSKRTIDDGVRLDAVERNAINPSNFQFNDLTALEGRQGLIVNDEGDGFLHPDEIFTLAKNDTSATYVDWIYAYENELSEKQYAANLKAEYSFNISDNIVLDLEIGGKYKWLDRDFDQNSFEHPMTWSVDGDEVRILWSEIFQEQGLILDYAPNNANFPYSPFIDQSYDGTSFLDGQFNINRVPNADLVRDLIEQLYIIPLDTNLTYNAGLALNYPTSLRFDYDGDEQYYAAYVLPTLKIGETFTLIPGLRYEQNNTRYTGLRANGLNREFEPFPNEVVESNRSNEFWLPMIHARINLTDWFDIKASYTETISRPSFNLITPSWLFTPDQNLFWNNPTLVPIESDNYDVTLSFYGSKIGLFSIGGFYKSISNFIYQQDLYVIEEENLLDEYPAGIETPATIQGFINNPNDATLYGLEIEWQSNFWFLPGVLSGLVAGFNYTYTHSELIYPFVSPLDRFDIFTTSTIIIGSEDLSYKSRLLDQPDHIANVTLGFDYKKFSFRASMRHNSGVFVRADDISVLEEETEPITFFDVSLTQKLPFDDNFTLFVNATNITGAIDETTNVGSNWHSSKEYYGSTIQLGVRYNFFNN